MKNYDALIEQSALRPMDELLHSHYGPGKLLVIGSEKGLGKSSILTQIAIDHLLRGRQIVHISFASSMEDLILWYDTLIWSMTKELKVDFDDLKEYISKNRMLLNFTQENVSIEKISESIANIKSTVFPALTTIFIEGFSFLKADVTDLARIKHSGCEVWMVASFDNQHDKMVLKPYETLFDRLILLEKGEKNFTLRVDREEDPLPIIFDPTTMLLKKP